LWNCAGAFWVCLKWRIFLGALFMEWGSFFWAFCDHWKNICIENDVQVNRWMHKSSKAPLEHKVWGNISARYHSFSQCYFKNDDACVLLERCNLRKNFNWSSRTAMGNSRPAYHITYGLSEASEIWLFHPKID
jgi:hypothetical protein